MKSSAKLGRLTWIVIAVIHFCLSNLILPLTLALTKQAAATPEGTGMAVALLVQATQLLHFPLVTLALYPREWFPGEWVYVPMAANSLLWATGIYWLVGLFRKAR